MLGVNTDLATMAPANLAGAWRQRIDHGAEECSLSLTIVSDDGRPPAVIDLQVDIGGDFALGVADRQTSAAQSGAFAWFDQRRANCGCWLVVGNFHSLQAL